MTRHQAMQLQYRCYKILFDSITQDELGDAKQAWHGKGLTASMSRPKAAKNSIESRSL